MAMNDALELVVADAAAWRTWLDAHESSSEGVRLVIAKKGTTSPTRLTYAEALEEALCSGWIDGRRNARDDKTFYQHFTPRRKRSIWSLRNVGIVEELVAAGRMRERGHAEIALARADGRWERAYSAATMQAVPDDLRAALDASPAAAAAFEALGRTGRSTVVLDVTTAASPEVRARRISRHVERLAATA